MARKVVVTIECDICALDDIISEGVELPPIAVGTAKPRVLAACKEHRISIEDFLEILKTHGQVPENGHKALSPGKLSTDEQWCQFPGCEKPGPLKSRATLQAHMRSTHNTTLADFEARGGDSDAQAALPLDEKDYSEFKCDLPDTDNPKKKCGWMPPQSTSRPEQSRSMHRFRVHGIKKGEEA